MASPKKRRPKKKSPKVAAYAAGGVLMLGPHGLHHDLAEIFTEVNQTYFQNRIKAVIRWSRRYRRPPRTHHKVHFGECLWQVHSIIIHSTLDRAWVPRWFVSAVVYHEMLHIELPPRNRTSGRLHVHHSAFREAEQLFANYKAAQLWERKYMSRLLRF